MDNSVSETGANGENPNNSIFARFERLNLNDDGGDTTEHDARGETSPSSDIWGEKFFVTKGGDYSWKPNQYLNEDSSPNIQHPTTASSSGYPSTATQSEASSSNQHPIMASFSGYSSTQALNSDQIIELFRGYPSAQSEASSSNQHPTMESFGGYPSTQFEASSSNQHPTMASFSGYPSMQSEALNSDQTIELFRGYPSAQSEASTSNQHPTMSSFFGYPSTQFEALSSNQHPTMESFRGYPSTQFEASSSNQHPTTESFRGYPSTQFEASSSNQHPTMESFRGYPSTQFEASSSNQHPTMASFCGYPPMANYVRFRPGALRVYNIDQQPNNRVNNTSTSYSCRREIDVRERSRDSYLSMMTDRNKSAEFQKIIKGCINDEHLDSIVEELFSSTQSFVDAACCRHGFDSMRELIKRLKRTGHAFTLTRVLSTRFVEMMTDTEGKNVIQLCFVHFGNEPNQIFVDKAIYHFHELAMDKVGCVAINETINRMNHEQGSGLLNLIVDHSAYLSTHCYGNYIIQNAIRIRDVNTRIMLRLQGEYVELAKSAGGSKVVEECMKLSVDGLTVVVKEILANRRAPSQLAQDRYGNYVIQTGLERTKEYGLGYMYYSLVESLLPHWYALGRTLGGQHVVNLLRNDPSVCRMM